MRADVISLQYILTCPTGDCSQTFNGCNSAFLQCNINQCDRDFPNRGLKHWSCNKAAHLYGNAVTGSIGMGAFASATKESCDCKCSDPNLKACGDKCVDTKTDPNNCGDCNFFVSVILIR